MFHHIYAFAECFTRWVHRALHCPLDIYGVGRWMLLADRPQSARRSRRARAGIPRPGQVLGRGTPRRCWTYFGRKQTALNAAKEHLAIVTLLRVTDFTVVTTRHVHNNIYCLA